MHLLALCLRSAVSARSLICASLLLTAGCTNTLNRAIYREKPEAIQKFLAAGANVNEANEDGGTPLIYAAQYGDITLVKTLLDRGAIVNSVDRDGNSALSYLASGNVYKNDIVALLIARGANVNAPNHARRTPLHLAVMKSGQAVNAAQQRELIAMLIAAGADANRLTERGELPLHLGAFSGQPDEVLAQLLHATAQPKALTGSGYNALSEAARGAQHAAALFLADYGIEPQKFAAKPPSGPHWPVELEITYAINARAHEAMADCLAGRGDQANALINYRDSALSYEAAVNDCQNAVKLYTDALADAKAGRKNRIFSAIAINALGTGLGLATGVGFFAVPKKVDNHIDEYADALERDTAQLTTLTHEQAELSAKLNKIENATKAARVASDGATQASPIASSTIAR